VRLWKAADAIASNGILRGGLQRETEKAADVIILVKDAEDALCLLGREFESSQGHGMSEAACELPVFLDHIAQAR